jgi:hypothetical protein
MKEAHPLLKMEEINEKIKKIITVAMTAAKK